MNDSVKVEPLKLLLIGDSTVGKTCLYLRFTTGLFTSNHITTIGVDYFPATIALPDQKEIDIRLWDTAGQDRFRAITKTYIRGAHGILLLYDISCKKSFDNVVKWLAQVKEMSGSPIPVIIIGNKCDLESKREVTLEQGKEFATQNECLFTEASAKDNININECIGMITEKAHADYLIARQKEISPSGKKLKIITKQGKCCKN